MAKQDLRGQFPDRAGFSRANVFYMRSFYLTYSQGLTIVQQPVGQIPADASAEKVAQTVRQNPADQTKAIVPQAVGQIPDELATIPWGHNIVLILCKEQNHIIVEYTLRHLDKPLSVASYKLLPENIKSGLPSPEELQKAVLVNEGRAPHDSR